jgi:ActR/RegA family two-component response regulator
MSQRTLTSVWVAGFILGLHGSGTLYSLSMTRPRLLLVEPDDAVRRVLGRVLTRHFEVTPLATAASALGRLAEERFDRMVYDVTAGALVELRTACARHTGMRVVVIGPPDIGLALGAAASLDKPFHTDAILRALA